MVRRWQSCRCSVSNRIISLISHRIEAPFRPGASEHRHRPGLLLQKRQQFIGESVIMLGVSLGQRSSSLPGLVGPPPDASGCLRRVSVWGFFGTAAFQRRPAAELLSAPAWMQPRSGRSGFVTAVHSGQACSSCQGGLSTFSLQVADIPSFISHSFHCTGRH